MAKSNKPWERGYIPPAKTKPTEGWTVPAAPPGWHAIGGGKRFEAVFAEGELSPGDTPASWARLRLKVARGKPWQLVYRGINVVRTSHDELVTAGYKEEILFEAADLDSALVWLKVERENGEDPRVENQADIYQRFSERYGYAGTRTGRFRMQRSVIDNITVHQADRLVDNYRAAYGTKVHQTLLSDLERYCKANVEATCESK